MLEKLPSRLQFLGRLRRLIFVVGESRDDVLAVVEGGKQSSRPRSANTPRLPFIPVPSELFQKNRLMKSTKRR